MSTSSNATEIEAMRKELTAFGETLAQKRKEFSTEGHLTATHEAELGQIEAGHAELSEKFDECAKDKSAWSLIKAEFLRDFRAAAESFDSFVERLDSDQMKKS